MSYTSIKVKAKAENLDILIALMEDLGFEGFLEENSKEFSAFIPSKDYIAKKLSDSLNLLKTQFDFEYTLLEIEEENWNAKWESSFEPVEISSKLRIKAPFHSTINGFDIEIVIEPKMSFGTGHHSTTYLMSECMFDVDIKDKVVLDAGSGTGLLAILAEKLGAKKVVGFDIEEWAFKNSLENQILNACKKVSFFQSDARGLPFGEKQFDIVLANITKNILKEDIPLYLNHLRPKGDLLISGFFELDIKEMEKFTKPLGLEVVKTAVKNNWAVIQLSFKG